MDENNWRFHVDPNTGTITRGRLYRLGDDSDHWGFYWDTEDMVAFYDEGFRGVRAVEGTNPDEAERAISAYRYSGTEGLERVARRITGYDDACFVHVSLERDLDLYALSYGGDEGNEWRDEIEAVWNGEVYRIEVEEYASGMGPGGSDWVSADDVPEEAYGEVKAERWFEREFPLDAFPADVLVVSNGE